MIEQSLFLIQHTTATEALTISEAGLFDTPLGMDIVNPCDFFFIMCVIVGARRAVPSSVERLSAPDGTPARSDHRVHQNDGAGHCGLLEVDAGSYRSRRYNQAALIAEALGHYHVYHSKYPSWSLARRLPVMGKQVNAFLCRDAIHARRFHFFKKGVKRLVIELELRNLVVFSRASRAGLSYPP